MSLANFFGNKLGLRFLFRGGLTFCAQIVSWKLGSSLNSDAGLEETLSQVGVATPRLSILCPLFRGLTPVADTNVAASRLVRSQLRELPDEISRGDGFPSDAVIRTGIAGIPHSGFPLRRTFQLIVTSTVGRLRGQWRYLQHLWRVEVEEPIRRVRHISRCRVAIR